MADKAISELIAANQVTPTDLFVLEQSGTAKKLTGQVLENWLVSFADGHGGIQSIAKLSTSGLADTYRITLADTTTFDFVVTNGRSINSVAKTSTSGLVDTYTITYNNGTTSTFTVKNGEKGNKGDNAYVWIKYASQQPTEASHSIGDIPDNWIGIYSGNASTAPSDWKQYKWYKHKGEKGDTGVPATLANKSVTYQVGDSGSIIPSGMWVSSVPVVPQGKYLWTKTEIQFNTGDPVISYSVTRMGLDGSGSVASVNNVSPDENGNVSLTADNVGALPTTGGDLTGELRMNGQPISGLNEPTEGTQAAPKSYVDKRVPLDGSQAMGGNLSMGWHKITGIGNPVDAGDAATKGYADTKAALPKTASGTVIALSDASYGLLQGLRIYGRTTQDGTPTPDAPVELVSVGDGGSVGVTVAGKNLVTGITNGNSENNYGAALYAKVDTLLPDTDYFISFIGASGHKCYSNENLFNYSVFTCTGSRQGLRIHTKKSISKDALNCYNPEYGWYIFKNNAGNTVVPSFSDVQIEAGTVMTAYEAPVPAQTLPISTPNGLPGIPVTSGGNYTDADGQQWICDEVDFARGVYVQRVVMKEFDGTEHFGSITLLGDVARAPSHILNTALNGTYSGGGLYSHGSYKAGYSDNTPHAYVDNDLIWLFLNVQTTVLSDIQDYLRGQYENGTPVSVLYKLITPIETPIPADELAAYAAMHTNRPNTTVYNDAGAYMDVGYYPPDATMRQEDIKEYVDAKHFLATVSIPAVSWTGDAAPYTQTVPVSGILATDFPHITPVYSSTLATALAQKEAWSMVSKAVSNSGKITFTCFEEKPATAIPIQIEVTR